MRSIWTSLVGPTLLQLMPDPSKSYKDKELLGISAADFFCRPNECLSCRPANSVKALNGLKWLSFNRWNFVCFAVVATDAVHDITRIALLANTDVKGDYQLPTGDDLERRQQRQCMDVDQWWGLRPSVLGQDRSETKTIGLGLVSSGLGLGLVIWSWSWEFGLGYITDEDYRLQLMSLSPRHIWYSTAQQSLLFEPFCIFVRVFFIPEVVQEI